MFALVADDFAIRYIEKEDARHLIRALESKYAITKDWKATKFCGIDLNWNYRKRKVTLSMIGYVKKLLHKLQHKIPFTQEHNPHIWTAPKYGTKVQYAPNVNNLPIVSKDRIKRIQTIIGSLLYYARAIDHTILMALNDIAAIQTKATTETESHVNKLLNYIATHQDASLTYHASKMHLIIHSDASYLSVSNSRSRAGGYFYTVSYTHLTLPTSARV